jgi:hypothetical protein
MDESRLTFTQKTGFQSILRNGKALPIRPMDLFRQQLYKHRHAERARSMGVSVMNPTHNPFMSRRRVSFRRTKIDFRMLILALHSCFRIFISTLVVVVDELMM